MVRFHWPVEGTQHCAWVPSGGVKLDEGQGVRHITVDMELAGQNETVMSLLTVPADYLDSSKVSPLGIVLGHGSDAEGTWRAPLLEKLAAHFAAAGHVVVRYFCPLKEQRRHRIFEKTFDVAAASPYAAPVKRWVLLGYDNGARIAAGVGAKLASRAAIAGFAFLSYPLLDPAPPPPKQKAGAIPPADSVGPLAKLNEFCLPTFFLCGEFDRLCPGARLKEVLAETLPGCDTRVVVLEGLSGRFCVPGTKVLEDDTLAGIIQHVQTFITALQTEGQAGAGLAACPLPKACDLTPSERPLPDVPESPKREPSPEVEEEPEPDSPPPPSRAVGRAARRPSAAAAPAAAGQQHMQGVVRPGVPPGMIPVMGPNGQPMLVPASAVAGNPAMQQQLMMMQQHMLAHMKQQQAAAAGGGGGAGALNASAAQQQMQMQMAMAMQQMAAAAAAGRPAGAAGAPSAAAMQQMQQQHQQQMHMQQQMQLQQHMQQQLQQQQQQQAAAHMAFHPPQQ